MEHNRITRTDLLNHLAEKHGLKKYLEVGVNEPTENFDKIVCKHKVAVDPSEIARKNFYREAWRPHYHMFFNYESDVFFESWRRRPSDFVCTEEENKFDLIFIDGLHTAEQVKKDFENALKILSPGGFIVLHDCNPEKEEHTIVPRPTERGHWNGSCYKFAASLLHKGKFTVDIDNGCMVVPNGNYQVLYEPLSVWTWELFNDHRKRALNLISWDEFCNL